MASPRFFLRIFAQAQEATFSGTTAVSVLMRENELWIANAGDSRAVLAKDDGGALQAVDLSMDQNPNSPAEQVHYAYIFPQKNCIRCIWLWLGKIGVSGGREAWPGTSPLVHSCKDVEEQSVFKPSR